MLYVRLLCIGSERASVCFGPALRLVFGDGELTQTLFLSHSVPPRDHIQLQT